MHVKEKKILRLTIEYDNTKEGDERDEVADFLDARFGRYNYRIMRSGPKSLGEGRADMSIGEMVVEVDA